MQAMAFTAIGELPIEKDISDAATECRSSLATHEAFPSPMMRRDRGRIPKTASVAGFEPGPLLATYFATKAFVLSWSEAPAAELNKTAISVTALCPGVTDTDFFEKADAENIQGRQSSNVMSPQEVAKVGYKAMIDGELFVVPGGINKAMVAARRIMSVGFQAKLNAKINKDIPSKEREHHRGEKEAVSPWRRLSW
jgi:short-subunit dehydrogenase